MAKTKRDLAKIKRDLTTFKDITGKKWYSETGKQWLSKGRIVNIQINESENTIHFFFEDGSMGEIISHHEEPKEGGGWSAVIMSDIVPASDGNNVPISDLCQE